MAWSQISATGQSWPYKNHTITPTVRCYMDILTNWLPRNIADVINIFVSEHMEYIWTVETLLSDEQSASGLKSSHNYRSWSLEAIISGPHAA